VLLVELVALVVTLATVTRSVHAQDLRMFGALAGMGIAQAELARRVERVRRRINTTPHINMSSVWTFAGVVLLPVQLLPALVAVLYAHLAIRSWYGMRRVPPFRTVFNACLVTITCLTARGVLSALHFPGVAAAMHGGSAALLPLVLSAAAYFLVGALVAIPGLSITTWSWEAVLGSWADNGLEVATLCLGAVNAALLVAMPELTVAIIPPMLLLQRSVLVSQLEIAATTDDKTGVFNSAGWHHAADRELARAARNNGEASIGVLMIDLDHFKRVNDQHGHLAGDHVLRAVAETITEQVRSYDTVGRFGGEEFVVLLPNASPVDVQRAAERIRGAIAVANVPVSAAAGAVIGDLSASIGVAMYPSAGTAVDRLLHAADTALYRAKDAGRNQVVTFLPDVSRAQ
jgi:diguanylate cyclase (GGDEF)-like protein